LAVTGSNAAVDDVQVPQAKTVASRRLIRHLLAAKVDAVIALRCFIEENEKEGKIMMRAR